MMSTVLILGATSDIGFAIAEKFAAKGFSLQLASRRIDDLLPLQSDLQIRYGITCTIHSFDAMRPETHTSLYAQLDPHPDVCICVAGYMTDNEKAAADWSEAERTLHTNFTGLVSILNVVAADFRTRKQGVIAGISSVAGNRGRQSNYIYGSAKAGFTAYLSGLRNRMYREHVHVVTVLPGFVYTRMTQHLKLPGLLTARPAEVANAVFKGVTAKKNIVYVKWFWRWIMLIITHIPEFIFKKKQL